MGFIRCPCLVNPKFRCSFLLPSSEEQDETNRYLVFHSSCTGGYTGFDFGLLLNKPLGVNMWEEVLWICGRTYCGYVGGSVVDMWEEVL